MALSDSRLEIKEEGTSVRMDQPPLGAGPDDLAPAFMAPVPKHDPSCLNFSLETAIIVIMVFGVGALFSCCYNWGLRLQHNQAQGASHAPTGSNLQNSALEDQSRILEDVNSRITATQKAQQMKQECTMQVLMPGDDVPKFLAWTAPHRIPPVLDSSVV